MLWHVGAELYSLLLCYYEGLNLSYKLNVIKLVDMIVVHKQQCLALNLRAAGLRAENSGVVCVVNNWQLTQSFPLNPA